MVDIILTNVGTDRLGIHNSVNCNIDFYILYEIWNSTKD